MPISYPPPRTTGSWANLSQAQTAPRQIFLIWLPSLEHPAMAMHFIAGTSWTGAEIDPRTAQRILRIIRILATGRSRPQAMVAADDLAIRTGIHHERYDTTFLVLRDACRDRAVFRPH